MFHNSLLSQWFRDTPNDAVSPVGETSQSRCNRAARLPGPRRQKAPFHRKARALACHTRRREGFPRHRSRAGKNVSSSLQVRRTSNAPLVDGQRGGQAPALRKKTVLEPSRGTGSRATGTSRPGGLSYREESRPGGLSYQEGAGVARSPRRINTETEL